MSAPSHVALPCSDSPAKAASCVRGSHTCPAPYSRGRVGSEEHARRGRAPSGSVRRAGALPGPPVSRATAQPVRLLARLPWFRLDTLALPHHLTPLTAQLHEWARVVVPSTSNNYGGAVIRFNEAAGIMNTRAWP